MNPLEEFLMEKQAKLSKNTRLGLGHFGSAALGAAAVGAGSGIFAAGVVAANKIYNAATAKRDFRQMLQWHTDLQQEDQKLVNQAFRTLRQFAPDMSRDPLVSGAIVKNIVAAPQGAAGIIQESMQGQRNIGRPVSEAFLSGTQSGMAEGMKGFTPFDRYPTSKEMQERAKYEHTLAMRGEEKKHEKERTSWKKDVSQRQAEHAALADELAQVRAQKIERAKGPAFSGSVPLHDVRGEGPFVHPRTVNYVTSAPEHNMDMLAARPAGFVAPPSSYLPSVDMTLYHKPALRRGGKKKP
jgi:hypothetical protein